MKVKNFAFYVQEDKLKFDLLTKEKLAADENAQDLVEKVNSLRKEVEVRCLWTMSWTGKRKLEFFMSVYELQDLKERLDNYSNDQEDVHSSYEETRRDLLETRDKHEVAVLVLLKVFIFKSLTVYSGK